MYKKCVHCGAYHGFDPDECLAIKKITYRPYVYGPNGNTVSHAGIDSIEYFDLTTQRDLQELNRNAQPPEVEHAHD